MATVAEVLVRELMKNVGEEERARLDVAANQLGKQLVNFANDVGRELRAICCTVMRAVEKIEIDHKRGSLLRLYRRRHSWKKADLVRLQTYSLNNAARNLVLKLAASKRVGRGTTIAYEPIAGRLVQVGRFLAELHDSATPPVRRLRMLKQTTWWPEFVEMTYRGEYQRLKKLGGRATSARAEQAVADAYCISTATVKQLCHSVRKDPAARMAPNPPIEVADFEIWKVSGRLRDKGE